jgi:hypothetical protein
MNTSQLPPHNPLVRPQTNFDYLRLDNAKLPPEQAVILHDPAERFCTDRFKGMTARQQAALLADVACKLQSEARSDVELPFMLQTIRAHLKVTSDTVSSGFTPPQAADYYLDYPSKGRYLWIQEALQTPSSRELVIETLLNDLRTQLPAIAFTLAHIYSGGHYGLLTAREARDFHHACQIETISEMFGFAPQTELVYYVNDLHYSKRLGGKSVSTAVKKATVLTNFANGIKEDEEGAVVPMTLGKRFQEILFIDDEDKNLQAVMHCLVRGVCASVMDAIGMRFRTPQWEQRLNERAEQLTEQAYAQAGIASTHSMVFWRDLVTTLTEKYLSKSGATTSSEDLIAKLIQEGKWMPDVIKVYDGRKISHDPAIATLRSVFAAQQPVMLGTRESILFNDIDKNILSVNALFYIRRKGQENSAPLLTFNQSDFAEHSSSQYWIDWAAALHNIPSSELELSWDHFQKADVIRRDILEALYQGRIARNVHTS